MKTTKGENHIRSNNLGWYLLAECTLGEMMPDKGREYALNTGLLFQSFEELGVPPELTREILLILTGFAQNAGMSVKQRGLERPGSIRVICTKKVVDDASAIKTSCPDRMEPMMEPVPIPDPSGTILNGGWGYFIVERSRDSADSFERSWPLFDLYLYKEGC